MEHPITPLPELVRQWETTLECPDLPSQKALYIATQAARQGADQKLEACCKWVDSPVDFEDYRPGEESKHLRAFRRSKPPSLKK